MNRRPSLAWLLGAAAAVTCGSLMTVTPATAHHKKPTTTPTLSPAPDPSPAPPEGCFDLTPGVTEASAELLGMVATSRAVSNEEEAVGGVWTAEHEHAVTLTWSRQVAVDARSPLAADQCTGVAYVLNVYELNDAGGDGKLDLQGSFNGVPEGATVHFLGRATLADGETCVRVELVAMRDGHVVEAVPDRKPEPDGVPDPKDICLQSAVGAGSMKG